MAEDAKGDEEQIGEKKASGGGYLGPALALLVLIVFVLTAGFVLYGALSAQEETEDSQETRDQPERDLLEECQPVPLGDVMANVGNEQGLRYCKVNVELWVVNEQAEQVAREEVRRILHEALEERLHSFDMEELSSEYVHTKLRTTFKDELNNELRTIFRSEGTDTEYIEKVVLTGLLVQ